MNVKKNEDALLRVEKLTVCYDGEPVVQDISFQVKKGEILGMVSAGHRYCLMCHSRSPKEAALES